MKKKILFVTFCVSLAIWSCQNNQSADSSFKDLERMESKILKSVSDIETYREGLEQILAESPEGENAPRASFKLAKLNEVFGHYEKALDYYTHLISLFPGDSLSGDGLFNLAQIYELHLEQEKKAITAYQQLITLYSSNKSVITAYLKLGQLYCKQNDWTQGLATFQLLIKKYPENNLCDDVQFRIADILDHQLKNSSEALTSYQDLIKIYPGSSWAAQAETRIKQLSQGGEHHEN
ncbi:MAG: tetratricopeptide repeat protein [Candidatus Zhuqueibacterota bacterium]